MPYYPCQYDKDIEKSLGHTDLCTILRNFVRDINVNDNIAYKMIRTTINHEGLSRDEVIASRRQHGENVLTPPKKISVWKLYFDKYRDPIIEILLVAAAISLVLAFVNNDFMETIGIFLAIFLATTVGFYFELDAAKKFEVLTAMNDDQLVKVRREGKVTTIPRREVVVGDVVLVEPGDEIPADARLFVAVNLQVDESALTGEPLTTKGFMPNGKAGEAYPANLILRSTMVMNGHGEAIVERIGDETEIGKVARQSTETTHTKTPLNIQLGKLAAFIFKVGSGVAVAAFVIFLVHDILTNSLWHTDNYLGMAQVVLSYFMMAVTLIVMAVPEGLPMAVNLALALNMRRMLKSNNLVRKLQASETMGAVTVICTDKTGTLTQNRMRVGALSLNPAYENADQSEEQLVIAMAVNSTAELDGDRVVGNPTEGALLLWLKDKGFDYHSLRKANAVVNQIPFSTERKFMATAVTVDGRTLTFVKGAPEILLNMCDCCAADRAACEQTLLGYQHQAMRTLAFAYGEGDLTGRLSSGLAVGLTLQGVCAISDPVREEVPAAVEECRTAGIRVKIVTGDTSATALEIARQIGIEEGEAITGPEWAALSDDEAYKRCEGICVMSRARPGDKQRLVEMLQKHGEVVAVTGDGTNDAPALNYAHVGLSLGSGTSVAKQASDITILNDSFSAIASAVMWGRSLYKNIQRFLFFQLVVNLSALLLVLGGSVIGTEMPLTVTQILWVNIIMDTFAALALASLPPSHEVMHDRPRKPSQFIITRPMARGILFVGSVFFIIMFVFLIWCERHGSGSIIDVHELTLFFTTFVMLQFWNLFNAKCLGSNYSAFRHFWRDRGLILVLALTFVGQWLIVTFGGRMFRTLPLSFTEWTVIIVATGVFVLGSGEIYRAVKRLRG
ncbi:calcium-translocating P-type ATPase, PMCA-type [Hallella multisaccharivorax DSM 17128]|uniref:Calcium-translocating P-type ATPase, PMCA-type n=2 Tax=Hallella multisaccharivorax TaxID=310514 RepID=F8NBT0_9BACT|nr:calcium-translocating P-type ATPase, PMCA-type [Hallella multisaccharivorax DSM 17128]